MLTISWHLRIRECKNACLVFASIRNVNTVVVVDKAVCAIACPGRTMENGWGASNMPEHRDLLVD